MHYSVIIPIYNEEESIPVLYEEIVEAFDKITDQKSSYEIIFINDGSTDNTGAALLSLQKDPRVKIITLQKNFGKAAALSHGFTYAKGDILITMDGDLQDDPAETYKLLEKLEEGYDMVSGWKIDRQDPADKTLPSLVFNFVVSRLSGLHLHDMNCGFKAYRKEVAKGLKIYSQLYRFIPVLVADKGYTVTEVSVKHRKRKFGKSKYNWQRLIVGFIDLFTVLFITRYAKRPMHLFGPIGFITLLSGLIFLTYLIIEHFVGQSIGRRPLFTFAILLVITGLQIVFTGLIAELITNYFHRLDDYPEKIPPIKKEEHN